MTVEEMEDLLDRLGIEIISINGDEIKSHCPAHLEAKVKKMLILLGTLTLIQVCIIVFLAILKDTLVLLLSTFKVLTQS